jgi:hypothetical protein
MAASKSASRRSAARKASKSRKPGAAVKKASKTRKQRVPAKKAAATPKRRIAARKPLATRKTQAAAAAAAKPAFTEIDGRIAIVRANLRELVEQAASNSGAANEELMSQRIADQEAKLQLLLKQREELSQRAS